MKEIKIKKIGNNTTSLLVEFYDTGVMVDWQELFDTKDIQVEISKFLFGGYRIIHN